MASETKPGAPSRHYWLPITHDAEIYGGTRHAFEGRRWDGNPRGTTICNQEVNMKEATETEWFLYPTCDCCNRILKTKNGKNVPDMVDHT